MLRAFGFCNILQRPYLVAAVAEVAHNCNKEIVSEMIAKYSPGHWPV